MTALRVSRDLSLSTDDDSLQMLTEHALIPFRDVVTYGMGILVSMSNATTKVYLFGIEVGADVTRAYESLDVFNE